MQTINHHQDEESDRIQKPLLTASEEAVSNFSEDVGCLWCPSSAIPVLECPPDALTFLRDYVSRSMPCIIRNAMPGREKLGLDELCQLCPSQKLTVDVTPDGHGDCVRTLVKDNDHTTGSSSSRQLRHRMFVKPQERIMTFENFRERLRDGQSDFLSSNEAAKDRSCTSTDEEGLAVLASSTRDAFNRDKDDNGAMGESSASGGHPVLYYSRQNDCLRTELQPLFEKKLFPDSFSFAEEAFGTGPPDAINLWIGDERAVSSMHKDHYENLFYVSSGQKIFTLCPPGDAPFLYGDDFDSGVFWQNRNDGSWSVVPEYDGDGDENENKTGDHSQLRPSRVRWIEANVEHLLNSEDTNKESHPLNRYPLLARAHPIQIRVNEGEMLYLPSLWFHRVTQSCETVGINYWYDMKFDSPLWCYFNFIQQLERAEPGTTRANRETT